MKSWLRYGLAVVVGLVVGVGSAAYAVRSGAFGSGQQIGPWRTGTDYGTAEASARTRAIVALSGLLALPAREARYYTAVADDAGAPLDGNCSYTVSGGELPGRWWSLTLYDGEGYLVANDANRFSVASAALAPAERKGWTIKVSPTRTDGHWLPSGGAERFQLTLRTYRPADEGRSSPPRDALPRIAKGDCA
ncbi:DUF1214 domain-containing protein [Sphingoaurantiacus capsulatus]|uniref:DUF1214 domain-containing protein n=1 Tax=Sphingoaurantiacus capsulatus TaxID=1771310 RepID=A0ABV7X555_9SPHN